MHESKVFIGKTSDGEDVIYYSGGKIAERCHSRVGGNPEKHWMPDQVRHDGVGYLVAKLISYNLLYLFFRIVFFDPKIWYYLN